MTMLENERRVAYDWTLNTVGVIIGVFYWLLYMPLKVALYKLSRFINRLVFDVTDYNLRAAVTGGRSDRHESIIFYKIRKEMRANRKRSGAAALLSLFNYFNYLKYHMDNPGKVDAEEKNYLHLFHNLDLGEVLKKYLFVFFNLILSAYILFAKCSGDALLQRYRIYVSLDVILFHENLNSNGSATLNIMTFFLVVLIYLTNNNKQRKDIANWLTVKLGTDIGHIKDSKHTVLNSISDIEQDLKKFKFVVFEQIDGPDILLCTTDIEEIIATIEFRGMVEDNYFVSGKSMRIIQVLSPDNFAIVLDGNVCCHAYRMEKDRTVVKHNFFQIRRILKYGFHIGIRELNFYDFVSMFILVIYFLTSINWEGIVDYIFVLWSLFFPVFFANVKRYKSVLVAFDFYAKNSEKLSVTDAHRSLVASNDGKIITTLTGYDNVDKCECQYISDHGVCFFDELKTVTSSTHAILSCIVQVLEKVDYNWPVLGLRFEDFHRLLVLTIPFTQLRLYFQFKLQGENSPLVISYENIVSRQTKVWGQDPGFVVFKANEDNELTTEILMSLDANARVFPHYQAPEEFFPVRYLKKKGTRNPMV